MDIDKLVDRFLTWELPKTVCSDLCVTDRSYQYSRTGTSLLTAEEAKQMLMHVLQDTEKPSRLQELNCLILGHQEAMRPLLKEWAELYSKDRP
jgi:hypothetical protein